MLAGALAMGTLEDALARVWQGARGAVSPGHGSALVFREGPADGAGNGVFLAPQGVRRQLVLNRGALDDHHVPRPGIEGDEFAARA